MAQDRTAFPIRPLFESKFGIRLLYCGRYECKPEWRIESFHFPENMTGFFFLERNCCRVSINDRSFKANQGDLIIMQAGDRVELRHSPAEPITALSLGLALEYGIIPNVVLHRAFERRYRISNQQTYIEAFDAILQSLSRPLAIRDLAASGALLQWGAYLLDETQAPLKHPGDSRGVKQKILAVQAWITTHLSQPLTLTDMARETGWHPIYFHRVFKRETGSTPVHWLEDRRMDAARQYLATTDLAVGEVSRAVGYEDPFYFSRVFRKHFGSPPLQFRKSGRVFC